MPLSFSLSFLVSARKMLGKNNSVCYEEEREQSRRGREEDSERKEELGKRTKKRTSSHVLREDYPFPRILLAGFRDTRDRGGWGIRVGFP